MFGEDNPDEYRDAPERPGNQDGAISNILSNQYRDDGDANLKLSKLIRRRGAFKSLITRYLKSMEEECNASQPRAKVIKDFLIQLKPREEALQSINLEIEELIIDSERYEREFTSTQDYLSNIIRIKDLANQVLNGEREPEVNISLSRASANTGIAELEERRAANLQIREQFMRENGSHNSQTRFNREDEDLSGTVRSNSRRVGVRLPKIEIRKFNGEFTDWTRFWSQFESNIHTNDAADVTDKFSYLTSLLEGPALNEIKGYTASPQNYQLAIQTLHERFGRSDIVAKSHLKALKNQAPIHKASDVVALRKLYNNCEVQLRCLYELGQKKELNAGLLGTEILDLLPKEISLAFYRTNQGSALVKIDDLMAFLKVEITCREQAYADSKNEMESKSANIKEHQQNTKRELGRERNWAPNKPKFASAAALTTTVQDRKCILCEETGHNPINCIKISVNERREMAAKKRCCFICLKQNHLASDCYLRSRKCKYCNKEHHPALCNTNIKHKPEKRREDTEPKSTESRETQVSAAVQTETVGVVLLNTAKAILSSEDGSQRTGVRILLDEGSQGSFIRKAISRQLKLPVIREESYSVHPFGGGTPIQATRRRVKVELRNKRDPTKRISVEAAETPDICGGEFKLASEEIIEKMKGKGLPWADSPFGEGEPERTQVDLLIGSDYLWAVTTGKTEKISETLTAKETTFDWTVAGPTQVDSNNSIVGAISVSSLVVENEDEMISRELRRFFDLEAMGITDTDAVCSDNSELLELFEKNIKFQEGRYEISFPWKKNKEQLSDNYPVALKRTRNLITQLKKDPKLLHEYNEVIKEQVEQGIAELVTPSIKSVDLEKIEDEFIPIFYLPHRAVIRKNHDTTKLRVVQDASSHEVGKLSLNECLETGPNLNPELLDVLIRFREGAIAFIGDVEKAFLQISINENDRDVLRFLWPDIYNIDSATSLQVYRMTRLPFGVTASPFVLAEILRYHARKYSEEKPRIWELVDKSFYVDDLAASTSTVEDAYYLTTEAAFILKEAGMNLRKFKSNSRKLRKLWNLPEAPSSNTKVLGLYWDENRDVLVYDCDSLVNGLSGKSNTKRWILKIVARIFDPLGFLSPFTIRAKFILQLLWVKGTKWDSELDEEVSSLFENWCDEIKDIKKVEIPRFYFGAMFGIENSNITLHCFVDASKKAFAACVYLRFENEQGEISTSLVIAKTRVAPIKKLKLPRLELMAAVLGARLVNYLLKTLKIKISSTHLWSDSTIALYWIKGSASKWKPFVSNRVSEIQTLTDPRAWKHVKGTENPADLPTRGKKVNDLITSSLWWSGPKWLRENRERQDENLKTEGIINSEEVQEELLVSEREGLAVAAVQLQKEPFLDLDRFSNLEKANRITAHWLRYMRNLRNPNKKVTGELSAEELIVAECYWARKAQEKAFQQEISALRKGEKLPSDSKILTLEPFLDQEGLLCVGGRINEAKMTYRERHPWILPSDHRFSELLALHLHERLLHGGVNDTLIELREKYWLLRGRQVVKKAISHCYVCRRFKVKPANMTMAPLPASRVAPAPPFEVCGLDFAGPLYTRKQEKCYIALFTCGVTRSIHLELVSDMTTDKFLLALRRFIARRGMVRKIISDNAKTFKKAEADLKEIRRCLKAPEVQKHAAKFQISWVFIADRAPWWGGFYERLVRSVKTVLKKVLGQARLSHEELETILTEVEAVINSRPITFTYNDVGEPRPLTPAHFLIGDRLTAIPARKFPVEENPNATREILTKRLKYREILIERFWNRWLTDYLMELRSAHHRPHSKPTPELKVDDVVLVSEPKIPRQNWKMAIVQNTHVGRDGKIRSCHLRLSNGSEIRRPIQLLYPLELS